MKRPGFLYFFRRSLFQRKGRIVIACFSVTLAVAIVTALAGITSGIKSKLGSELRAYGANMIIAPGNATYINYRDLVTISGIEGVDLATGQIFGRALLNKSSIEVIGLDTERLRNSGWRITGRLPLGDMEILAGINLKTALELKPGKTVSLSNGPNIMQFHLSGFVERGGPEDNSFIMPIESAWKFMEVQGKLSAILVRAQADNLSDVSNRIRQSVQGITVKTLRQVADAESSLLRKIQLLMIIVTCVVLFAAVISIMSTMGANVLERREEIGLMKAIGATRNNIRMFYLVEAIVIGLTGGVGGFIIGYAFTQAVSYGAFDSFIRIPIYFSFISIASGVAIAMFAGHFPVSDALKYSPAVILREE